MTRQGTAKMHALLATGCGKRVGVALFSSVALCAAAAQQPRLSDLNPPAVGEDAPLVDVQKLIDAHRLPEAEASLRVYLRQNDLSSRAHEMLAYTLLREDKPRESLAEYTRAAALHTPSAATLVSVAQDYVLLNDNEQASHWLLRAIEMEPRNQDAWYNLGRLRYTQQRFSDSATCFQHVLTLAPHSVKAENNLGLAYEALGDLYKAIAAYRQAIAWQESGPQAERSEQPLLNLSTVLLHQARLDEAEPLLLEAATLAPRDSRVHEQLGHLYLQQAKYAQAQKEFEQACALAPNQSGLHFLLGQAYRHQGMERQAQTEFATASRLAQATANTTPQ